MTPGAIRSQSSLHEQTNGLVESGFSASSSENHRHASRFISRPLYSSTARFGRASSFSSPRSGNGRFQEHPPHFLDACFLCKKPLGCNRDIFMYRGDTPFCSEECRADQIEFDEAREKKTSLSASIKAMRKKEESEKSSSSSPEYPFHPGAVAAA